MSINSYLEDVASKLIIRDDEREAISKSVDVFKDRMKDYFSSHESVNLKEIKIFGSYDRDTDLPQSIDYDTDVDIMLVMNDDGCSPQTYLDRVRRAVDAYLESLHPDGKLHRIFIHMPPNIPFSF